MIFYITVLRAIAAILITNAHYTNIYPIEIIANGGLLGDVIFFAVSGFCLYNIKENFIKWYSKRIIRIYPAVWIITTIFLALGLYTLDEMNIFQFMIYPTYYHFIASIIILYIFYYIIIKCKVLNDNIPKIMIGIFAIQLLVYIFIYDKSYYHIDVVREPMIRFLFLESMLLGALFRKRIYDNKKNNNKMLNWIMLVILIVLYFASKLCFAKNILVQYQIINQIILFALLYFIFRVFEGIDSKLEKLPTKIKNVITFIAQITLEIYLVQYKIIPLFRDLIFPINWFVITAMIIVSAYLLHIVTNIIVKFISKALGEKVWKH